MKNVKNWSSWVPITKIFCVPHAIDEKSRNRDWKDITMDGRTGGIKGAFLIEDNGYLEQSDVGIYWIKIEKPSKKYKTSTWNYIGKSAKFSGRPKFQIGIAARVCEHINKMQNWPHRGDIIDALIRKYLKQLGEDCSLEKFKKEQIEKVRELRQNLRKESFSDYQSFRDYLSHNGKQTYRLEEEFGEFFTEHKNEFKNFDTTSKFFECVSVRFLKLPLKNYPHKRKIDEYKEKNTFYSKTDIKDIKNGFSKNTEQDLELYLEVQEHFEAYVDKAEGSCMGAFKAAISEINDLPEFNHKDETKGFLNGFTDILNERFIKDK